MTLFFISKDYTPLMGKNLDENAMRAVHMADVIVIVDKKDRWLTTKDRFDAHGQYLHPRRQGELLATYHVISRPTNGEAED
jgi:hypothetical protein